MVVSYHAPEETTLKKPLLTIGLDLTDLDELRELCINTGYQVVTVGDEGKDQPIFLRLSIAKTSEDTVTMWEKEMHDNGFTGEVEVHEDKNI